MCYSYIFLYEDICDHIYCHLYFGFLIDRIPGQLNVL